MNACERMADSYRKDGMVPGVLLSKAFKRVVVLECESYRWAGMGDTDVRVSYGLSGERVMIHSGRRSTTSYKVKLRE